MYRLVKFSGFKVSRPPISSFQFPTNLCTLCGVKNISPSLTNLNTGSSVTNMVCSRHQGTSTDMNLKKEMLKSRRIKKPKKHSIELLEVLSGTSKQTKASVMNLKAQEVSQIACSPNVELDNFHKIKSKNKTGKGSCKKASSPSNSLLRNGNGFTESIQCSGSNKYTAFTENFSVDGKNFSTDEVKPEETFSTDTSAKNLNEFHGNKYTLMPDDAQDVTDAHESLSADLSYDINEVSSATSHIQEPFSVECEPQVEDLENCDVTDNTTSQSSTSNKKEKSKKTFWHRRIFRDKLAKENLSKLENISHEKSFNATLLAYLSVCVSCNFLQRGLFMLHNYRHRSRVPGSNFKITDIKIYEVLIRGFAAKGNINKVNELCKILKSDGLEPSLDIYALQIECAAKVHNKHMVSEVIKTIKDKGFHLNDIFVHCTFLGDQRKVILEAVQDVHPEFVPSIPSPSLCYPCSLLQELNTQQGEKNLRSPAEGLLNKKMLRQFTEEQLKNEFLFHLKIKSIEKRNISGDTEIYRKKLQLMRDSWQTDLMNGFTRDVLFMKKSFQRKSNLYPYLKVLDAQSYVDIMLKEVQRIAEGSETFSPSTAKLYRNLGNQVKSRYIYKFKETHGILDKTKLIYDKYCDWYLNPRLNNHRSMNGRQEWQHLLHKNQDGPSMVGEEIYWPSAVIIGIGKFLYNIIISDAKVDVNILSKTNKQHMLPAFYRVYRDQRIKVVEEIKPHPVLSKLFRDAAEEYILFDVNLVPMLSPPLPWTTHESGGYLTAKTDFIRLPDQALQQRKRLKEAPPEQLFPPLDSLNQLGSIPWRVNQPVLDTVIEIFNNGGSSKLEIPEPPYYRSVAEPITLSMDKKERYEAYRQRLILKRQKAEMYSLWCDALYKLSLANHLRDRIFWLPHNMDFRGRVYPVPPHLNHLGSDMPRSLLCFALGKPLGQEGLDWLKIHLVNLLGTKKKESIRDRLDYGNTLLSEILDSAEKPLTGNKWWMDSEHPWQTLACCYEIAAALQHPEGPENFVSHFPIHQDGSCNGLQHYAALGRDEAGACSVNLMPQDLPQDVYSCVAALVERERANDSAKGLKVAQELDGFVRRKVIKQTVMTTVYGVTRFGARLQIAKQLKDIDSFPKEYVWQASTYLVTKTFESLREMFNSTREIQDWFTECARQISTVCAQNVEYVTPLGLPVVQHYIRPAKRLNLSLDRFGHVSEFFPIDMFERPNVMKQKNAFPPNFIHSLDSSHMMLTSIFSERKGITFVSVHDCYWTHACDVHVMNQICREQFVALHSQPILEDLSLFMLKKYGCDERERQNSKMAVSEARHRLQDVLSQVPPKGSFILENVLDSVYFFS